MGTAYQWNMRQVIFRKKSLALGFGLFCLRLPGKVTTRPIMTESLNDCVVQSCFWLRTLTSEFYTRGKLNSSLFKSKYCWASYFHSLVITLMNTQGNTSPTQTQEQVSPLRISKVVNLGSGLRKWLFNIELLIRKATLQAIFTNENQSIRKTLSGQPNVFLFGKETKKAKFYMYSFL